MEKVIRFKLNSGVTWYNSPRDLSLCARQVQEYLDVGDKFDLHVSTRRPRDDEYYEIERYDDDRWELVGGEVDSISPWPSHADYELSRMFPKSKRLYVWAMG